jgi:hypothetical protein
MGPRSALLLRLAVLGVTLLVGAGVVALRARGNEGEPPAKSQLNGRTAQGFPVYGVQVDGAMGMVHVVWRGRCTRGKSLRWAVENVDSAFLPFHREGRAFSAVLRRPGYTLHGSTARETLTVSGTLSSDRRSASGTLRGRVDWTKGGRADGACDSGPVGWKLAAAG